MVRVVVLVPICVGGSPVNCGFNGVRSGFGRGIQKGSICSWEFCGEFDMWIYGIEVLLKFVDLIFPGSTVDICYQERSSQQTSRAPQFHRSTYQIHHRTPRNRWDSFLDTLAKHTPKSIESTVYRKPTHTDRYLDYNSNHSISAKLSVIHTLTHRAKQVHSTPELLAKRNGSPSQSLQDNHYPPQFFQQGKPKQKTNKKPNPSMEKFIRRS